MLKFENTDENNKLSSIDLDKFIEFGENDKINIKKFTVCPDKSIGLTSDQSTLAGVESVFNIHWNRRVKFKFNPNNYTDIEKFSDEDIIYSVESTNEIPILYRDGNEWRIK